MAAVVALTVIVSTTPAQAVVGGTRASIGTFPWMASVQTFNASNGTWSHACGGTLIGVKTILTQAACIANAPTGPQGLRVVLGRTDLNSPDGVTAVVVAKRVHPNFDAASRANDIAILHLNRIVPAPPALFGLLGDNPPPGSSVKVLGWGRTAPSGAPSPILQAADLPIVGQSTCQRTYPAQPFPRRTITANMFCAGGDGVHDVCEGDGGGPALSGTGLTTRVSGIISFVKDDDCDGSDPVVFTRVGAYTPWILANLLL